MDVAVVDVDAVVWLAPWLLDLDRVLSSLLGRPSLFVLADNPPSIFNGGNRPLVAGLLPSDGIPLLPMGVARFSLGKDGLGITRGGGAACEFRGR